MREGSGVSSNLRDLPGGGGGVRPLGDRFQPDLVRGTGNYSIPLHLPAGPNELKPQLTLVYSTGFGNGPFGLGWRLNPLRIERRSDRGVPRYTDEDEFVLADAGLLVRVGGDRYRPRVDTAHWLIRRIGDHWEVRDGGGRTLRFGLTAAAREGPAGQPFAWCLEQESDAAGNTVNYSYVEDNGTLYPLELRYGIFRVRFVYEPRTDVIRDGRAGFLREIRLRVAAIELHCERLAPTLMRTYSLEYHPSANGVSMLDRVTLSAEEDGRVARMPALSFSYTELDRRGWAIDEPLALVPPPSLAAEGTQFVDLTGDGLPDLLSMAGGRGLRWENQGGGRFAGPFQLDHLPSTVSLERSNVAFADLNANGRVDLFAVDQELQVAFQANGRGGFDPEPIVFSTRPSVALAEPATRLMDIDGDGVIDIIASQPMHHLLFRHSPGQGFQAPEAIARIRDLDVFPDVSFEDAGVLLADMNGDGLQDIVIARSGFFAYWPYLGNGSWAPRVVMANPPSLPDGIREQRLHLVEIAGSGCADVVYVDASRVLVWFNQSGNGFSDPVELPIGVHSDARVIAADIYGDGRPGLVWNSAPSSAQGMGCLALRFNPGVAPNLMSAVDNGMGGRFEIDYATSAEMRRLDQEESRPWPGELPLTVHVVQAIRDIDTVTGRRSARHIRYHDGVFDGPARDFRGFSEVDVISPGDESVPTNRQTVSHFTGDPHHPDLVERARQAALAGAVESTGTFELLEGAWVRRSQSHQAWEVTTQDDGGQTIFFPHLVRIETTEHGRDDPDLLDVIRYEDFDRFGNAGSRVRESSAAGASDADTIRSEERFTYALNEDAWLVKLPSRLEYRGSDGAVHAVQIRFYDGDPHTGLPEGQVARGLVTRGLELRLLDSQIPADYAPGRDFSELGYEHAGAGEAAGWYATTFSAARDARGNITENKGPLGDTMSFRYDVAGVYLESTTDAAGGQTRLTFNPRSGEPSEIVYPDGRLLRHTYDAIGRLLAQHESDADGNLTLTKCWFVDEAAPIAITSVAPRAAGRERAEFEGADLGAAGGVSVSRVFYDGFGQEAFQISTGPHDTAGSRRFVVTGQARLNPRGLAAVRFAPAFVDSLTLVPLPAGFPADAERARYDLDGRLADTGGQGGVRFRLDRDSFSVRHYLGEAAGAFHGEAGTPPPPAPGPPSRVDRFDARQRLVGIEERRDEAHHAITRYALTADGRLREVRDGADRAVVTYDFAGPGDPLRITHRDIGRRTYIYDAAGRLRERQEPDGSTTFFRHDAFGRVTRIEHDPGNGVLQTVRALHYDTDPGAPDDGRFLRGRIALIEEGDASVRFSYTPGGKTRREAYTLAGDTLALGRVYDLQGRVTHIEYPEGDDVEYRLDDAGAIVEIPGFVSNIAYDARGAIQSYRQANGVTVTQARNAASGRLDEISAEKDGARLRRLTYRYDPIGALQAALDEMPGSTEHHTFTYDGLYRLAGFDRRQGGEAGAVLQSGIYEHDDLGNLRRLQETAPLTLQYQDAARPGRLTSVVAGAAPAALTYNGRGHLQSFGQLAQIVYDPLDRVSRFRRQDGTEIALRYDHENRRVSKEVTANGAVTRTRYVTGLYEQHATHRLRHIFLGRELVATQRLDASGLSVLFYVSDPQGTLLLATDAIGAVVSNDRVSPFGALWSGGGLNRFLGRVADQETGLVHLGARFYAPQLGRFISADWFPLENPQKAALLPQAYNVYAYALNNPIAFRDASGLFFFIVAGVIAAIAIIAVAATAIAFTVGFVAGLVYGLANGQGWGSLLTALETALTTTAGMWLGAITGFLVAGPIGLVVGGAMGGLNGLISGMTGIYDWGSWKGWMAFLSDSTWGLIGTSLGNIVHIVNVFWPDSNYRSDLSHRQNRHVYEGGLRLKKDFAFTQGNVISNAGQGGKGIDTSFIAQHEELHIWQSRIFGPLFQLTYIVWGVGGLIVGTAVWLTDTDQDWGSLVETAAYYDNPFEYWAYKNDNNWPPSGANSDLSW